MNSIRKHWLTATAGAVAVWSSPALAQDTTATSPVDPLNAATMPDRNSDYLDLTAHLGYSSNPFLEAGNSRSSSFGRVSARGVHAWGG